MKQTRIGNVELGKTPRIVAIIDNVIPVEKVTHNCKNSASILEIRVDCFKSDFDSLLQYISELRNKVALPMIGTIRETDNNRDKRLVMFKEILPLVDAIDIEIDTPIIHDVISNAADKTVIISEHNFNRTPDNEGLSAIVKKEKKLGANIIKIAAMAQSKDDVIRLLTFTGNRPESLVTIAMGEIGTISRIAAPLFGSLFTYAFLTDKVAPGQLSLKQTVEVLKLMYPDF